MGKSVYTLVEDIYNLVSTKEIDESVDADAEIEKFGEAMKDLMKSEFSQFKRDSRTLRLSSIGHADRKLWHRVNGSPVEEIPPYTYVKFLYGHVIEEMLVLLTRLAGHTVTDQQKECEVEGIKGHMDCTIDGVLTDVKSASTAGFKKFRNGTLAQDDPFGYIAQIKAYAKSEGQTRYGWLAMDKQNGHLAYLMYDEESPAAPQEIRYDIADRVRYVKKMVEQPNPPDQCFPLEPDGQSGNMKLGFGCSYCDYKQQCYPDLVCYNYSGRPRFLAKVVREPRVDKIPLAELVDENN